MYISLTEVSVNTWTRDKIKTKNAFDFSKVVPYNMLLYQNHMDHLCNKILFNLSRIGKYTHKVTKIGTPNE